MIGRATGCLKKSGPRKKVLAIFSCWMVLYGPKQCCMIRAYRCAALDTPLAYIRKKIDPRPPGAQKRAKKALLGPKKGPKRPFWGPRRKNQNVRLQSHRNCGRFGTNLSVVALFVSELRSFFQWPPVVFYRFPICVSARGPPKRARIAFLLIDHRNHIEKESTWCARITRRIAPSG